MTDLHAAIEAAIAEDERLAQHAVEGPWDVVEMADFTYGIWSHATGFSGEDDHLATANVVPDAEHIARHDPASVLRKVEAYRWILDLHPVDCRVCDPLRLAPEGFACPTRRALAHAYAIEVPE